MKMSIRTEHTYSCDVIGCKHEVVIQSNRPPMSLPKGWVTVHIDCHRVAHVCPTCVPTIEKVATFRNQDES